MFLASRTGAMWVGGFLLLCSLGTRGMGQSSVAAMRWADLPNAPGMVRAAGQEAGAQAGFGRVSSVVLDTNGDYVEGASVTLVQAGRPERVAVSDREGRISFAEVPAGAFQLTVVAAGFGTQVIEGTVSAGENDALPAITVLPSANMTVMVTPSVEEMAQEQVKMEEKQRVGGVIPNFFVTYAPHPSPLTRKQKMELGLHSTFDPVNVVGVGITAGIEQAENTFPGFGQGAAGYGKRFGAAYGNLAAVTMFSRALLPALFKQDPRYYYKGTGTTKSRVIYALERSVICKGDNGKDEFNYSNVLGKLAAGGLSNVYYAPADRKGVSVTFLNTAISVGGGMVGNLLQEFVIRKLTPAAKRPVITQPALPTPPAAAAHP